MNKLCVLLSFNIILIILSILFKKKLLLLYSLTFVFLFLLYFKEKRSLEGFEIFSVFDKNNVSFKNLVKTNESLDKLISIYSRNKEDCIGEYILQKCERKCGYSSQDKIYTIIQQKGDKGLPCPNKEAHMIKGECIDRLCIGNEYCLEDRDCKSQKCNLSFECERGKECDKDDLLEFCQTNEECMNLNEKYKSDGIEYTWDGIECFGNNMGFKPTPTGTPGTTLTPVTPGTTLTPVTSAAVP
mgnify:CR=1 FL=1